LIILLFLEYDVQFTFINSVLLYKVLLLFLYLNIMLFNASFLQSVSSHWL